LNRGGYDSFSRFVKVVENQCQEISRVRVPSTIRLAAILAPLLLASAPYGQADSAAFPSPDSNSRVVVENAVVKGNETTVLFYTHPDLGDPLSGKPCPLNFYTAKLRPGLVDARANPVAQGVCGNATVEGRLLDNGDVLIVAMDRLERWRGGKRVANQAFGGLDATKGLGVDSSVGGQLYDITPQGRVVASIPAGGSMQRAVAEGSTVLVGLDPGGQLGWQHEFTLSGKTASVGGLWAANDGSALIRVSAFAEGSMAMQEHLFLVDNKGQRREEIHVAREESPDMEAFMQTAQATPEAAMAMLNGGISERIDRMVVAPRAGGGFNVLLKRKGESGGRQGHWLLDIGADGLLLSERSIDEPVTMHGLGDWYDFQLAGNELVLFSRASASQPGVQAKRKTHMQGLVSRIDLQSGHVIARRVPLDERYLAAAMSAGDEEVQYLDNLPGGKPALLTTLGGQPLAVSIGWLQRKQGLRLDAEADDWLVFTDAVDQRNAAQAKAAAREQRKSQRENFKAGMNADLAASVGMSPEQFAALSRKEQKEILVRQGDLDAINAAAMQRARQVSAAPPEGTAAAPAMPQSDYSQLAAAIAEAEQQAAAGTGNPAVDAQIAAAMAQLRAMQGAGGTVPGMPPGTTPGMAATAPAVDTQAADAAVPSDKALPVNANLQGFIEFENRDGRLATLLIYDRQTGEELLSKSYDDGVIYEYVDFGRYDRPLAQLGVMYRDISGLVLKDLTPVVTQ
jgi:hypothetical protein